MALRRRPCASIRRGLASGSNDLWQANTIDAPWKGPKPSLAPVIVRLASVALAQLQMFYCWGAWITPQAIRFPAFPVGSVFMSSAFSCTITLVPPFAVIEFGDAGSSER